MSFNFEEFVTSKSIKSFTKKVEITRADGKVEEFEIIPPTHSQITKYKNESTIDGASKTQRKKGVSAPTLDTELLTKKLILNHVKEFTQADEGVALSNNFVDGIWSAINDKIPFIEIEKLTEAILGDDHNMSFDDIEEEVVKN